MYNPLVLVIPCFGGQFGINCQSAFLKTLIFKISKNREGDLSQKSPEQTCHYCLITPKQKTHCTETNIFQRPSITNQRASN